MQLVEQHRIDRHDPRWDAIDAASFASKYLYNAALSHASSLHLGAPAPQGNGVMAVVVSLPFNKAH